jgi:hypothetical protein
MENLPLTEHGITVFDPGAAACQFWADILVESTYRKHLQYHGGKDLGSLSRQFPLFCKTENLLIRPMRVATGSSERV